MLKIKKVSEVLGKSVYTDSGEIVGRIEEVNLSDNKVDGWRIKLLGGISQMVGGARGIIVPHNFVKAISDVFIIAKSSLPIKEETEIESEAFEQS